MGVFIERNIEPAGKQKLMFLITLNASEIHNSVGNLINLSFFKSNYLGNRVEPERPKLGPKTRSGQRVAGNPRCKLLCYDPAKTIKVVSICLNSASTVGPFVPC